MQAETIEIFATKGVEYVMVIAYLFLLIVFWRVLTRGGREEVLAARPAGRPMGAWFDIPEGLFYHQGHGWAFPLGADTVSVGMDDFAQRLLGRPGSVRLPSVGARLEQGLPGWEVEVDERSIPMLSPVDGQVVDVNHEVLASPGLVNDDPYERGWLMKVRVPDGRAALRNLLTGRVAGAWMDETVERLRAFRTGDLGVVLPDGGVPVPGFVRVLDPDRWDEVAREFLLSD